jgi:hypothetical protein
MHLEDAERIHADHARFDQEHVEWRIRIQRWQREQAAMLEAVEELKRLLEDEGESLADLGDRIFEHGYEESVHESMLASPASRPEPRRWMEETHDRLASLHAEQARLLSLLGDRHELARVVLDQLVGMYRGEGSEP